MLTELRLPDLGEGVAEGEVAEWLVAVGDRVDEDTPLVEVMTDKATVQIPSPVAGTVASLEVAAGRSVAVGTVLLRIEVTAAPAPAAGAGVNGPGGGAGGARPEGAALREHDVPALPATRRLARDLGVDLTVLSPAAERVRDDDVHAVRSDDAVPVSDPQIVPAARRIPLAGRRRVLAEHLTRAAAVPSVTYVEEVEFDRLDALRDRIEARDGVRPAYLPFVVAAAAAALRRMPIVNSRVDEDAGEIVVEGAIDVGIAVDTEDGLLVPVLRGADRMGVLDLAAAIDLLAASARTGTLRPEQLRGATFTVSSAGRWGGFLATPILNHPGTALLGVHRARPRPVVHDGAVVVRNVANLSLTFDHRVLDGVAAARFTQLVIDCVEEPALLVAGDAEGGAWTGS